MQEEEEDMPIGAICAWRTTSVPAGWLECNGQSTAGYPALAAIIGSNVPDLKGRCVVGYDPGDVEGTDLTTPGKTHGVSYPTYAAHTHAVSGTWTANVGPGTAHNHGMDHCHFSGALVRDDADEAKVGVYSYVQAATQETESLQTQGGTGAKTQYQTSGPYVTGTPPSHTSYPTSKTNTGDESAHTHTVTITSGTTTSAAMGNSNYGNLQPSYCLLWIIRAQ